MMRRSLRSANGSRTLLKGTTALNEQAAEDSAGSRRRTTLACQPSRMAAKESEQGARYRWFGWTVAGIAADDVSADRLTETHEYFHRQLDDTTAFGGLVTTCAALAEAGADSSWAQTRDRLQAMSDLVHEVFAVGMSLLTTQRPLQPVDGYPMYDGYVAIIRRLLGEGTHPWVALAALRAVATVCMQSPALKLAVDADIERFDPTSIKREDRPNHRLAALLSSEFPTLVQSENIAAERMHGSESWWYGSEGVRLTPESMDGRAGELSQELHRRCFEAAATALGAAGAVVLGLNSHHRDLRRLLEQARELAPEGLMRIGALVESPGGELLHGGALDSQTITLTAAPHRASVLPYGSLSGLSGEGATRHGFLTVVRPERLRVCYELQGIPLPDAPAIACLRTTVFDGEVRDSLLLVVVDGPQSLMEVDVPIYVSLASSAAAAAPEAAAAWMNYADRRRLSLVMDTPATAALRRWCTPDGARFRTATRHISTEGIDLRIIAGRIENAGRQSALVVIPTTEFGARWFEAATHEDQLLKNAVVVDPVIFEEESDHMDVLLTHLLLEEPTVGTGSWRA
jgi:hypothetical protein